MNILELERVAYATGDTKTAELLARIAELEEECTRLEDIIQDTETLEDWENRNGPAAAYYQFFHDCFEHLSDLYPCPEIGSDYDQSIIFDAIRKGEGGAE